MLEAVARLTHDRRAERQKAIGMEELKSRAKLTTVSADPPTQMIELSLVVGDGREVRSVERAQVEPAYAAYKARMGDYPRPEEDVTGSVGSFRAPDPTQARCFWPGTMRQRCTPYG